MEKLGILISQWLMPSLSVWTFPKITTRAFTTILLASFVPTFLNRANNYYHKSYAGLQRVSLSSVWYWSCSDPTKPAGETSEYTKEKLGAHRSHIAAIRHVPHAILFCSNINLLLKSNSYCSIPSATHTCCRLICDNVQNFSLYHVCSCLGLCLHTFVFFCRCIRQHKRWKSVESTALGCLAGKPKSCKNPSREGWIYFLYWIVWLATKVHYIV